MMRFIIKQSLRFRFLVVAIAATMMLFGIGALRKMPVDVFPEFAPPRVQIQTACLGLTASEVEQLVTDPMEQAFYGIDGLDIVRSKSAPQLSALELIFKLGTDEMHARQLVQERLATVQNTLPTWAAPPVILQPLSATSRVLKIGITSDKVSLEDLSMQAYWTIRARLLRIRGVANIPMWGERIKAYQVEVDPGKLESAEGAARHRDGGDVERARCRPPEVLGGRVHRDRRVHRHAEPTARHPSQAAHHHGGGSGPGAGGRARRADVAHRRRRGGGAGGARTRRRRHHQQRSRVAARRREAAMGEHARHHEERREGHQGHAARPARREDRHDDLPARRVRAAGHRPPDRVDHPRRAAGAPGARPVPRTTGDRRSSASSPCRCRSWPRGSCSTCEERPSTPWSSRAW